jgi:hypothetical protein
VFCDKNSCAADVLEAQGTEKDKKIQKRRWKEKGVLASWYY